MKNRCKNKGQNSIVQYHFVVIVEILYVLAHKGKEGWKKRESHCSQKAIKAGKFD